MAQERRQKLQSHKRATEDDYHRCHARGESTRSGSSSKARVRSRRQPTCDAKMYNKGEQLSEAELISAPRSRQIASVRFPSSARELNDLNDRYALEAINHQHETSQLRAVGAAE